MGIKNSGITQCSYRNLISPTDENPTWTIEGPLLTDTALYLKSGGIWINNCNRNEYEGFSTGSTNKPAEPTIKLYEVPRPICVTDDIYKNCPESKYCDYGECVYYSGYTPQTECEFGTGCNTAKDKFCYNNKEECLESMLLYNLERRCEPICDHRYEICYLTQDFCLMELDKYNYKINSVYGCQAVLCDVEEEGCFRELDQCNYAQNRYTIVDDSYCRYGCDDRFNQCYTKSECEKIVYPLEPRELFWMIALYLFIGVFLISFGVMFFIVKTNRVQPKDIEDNKNGSN
jgi:hypothetical protein